MAATARVVTRRSGVSPARRALLPLPGPAGARAVATPLVLPRNSSSRNHKLESFQCDDRHRGPALPERTTVPSIPPPPEAWPQHGAGEHGRQPGQPLRDDPPRERLHPAAGTPVNAVKLPLSGSCRGLRQTDGHPLGSAPDSQVPLSPWPIRTGAPSRMTTGPRAPGPVFQTTIWPWGGGAVRPGAVVRRPRGQVRAMRMAMSSAGPGGQGGQQRVAGLADGQGGEAGQSAGQAGQAGADVGGGVLDEPVGVQDQGAGGG